MEDYTDTIFHHSEYGEILVLHPDDDDGGIWVWRKIFKNGRIGKALFKSDLW